MVSMNVGNANGLIHVVEDAHLLDMLFTKNLMRRLYIAEHGRLFFNILEKEYLKYTCRICGYSYIAPTLDNNKYKKYILNEVVLKNGSRIKKVIKN